MFKKIFKAAKDLIRSPVGQLGIGLLAPALFPTVSPALLQGGIGLLSGAKPEDVLRGVALGAGQAALRGGMSGRGGINEFLMGQPRQIAPAVQSTKFQAMQDQMSNLGRSTLPDVVKGAAEEGPGFLERFGLVKTGEGLDFFEKYSPLLKLGTVGASIAAAALGEDQAKLIYDPEKNPYLTGQVKITDAITPPGFNKGGGISDFPEKDGMINGPGDGQSDDIPAMLSDGEFVMTKQAVMAAGNGNREQGTKAMYNIMNTLEDKAESMGIGRM
tara:strand:+ start:64 stop:879 length:816 start_codon:yes stop_codon:yes gene_type:complete